MSAEKLIVFDVDGVLVDVAESYRETIQQTVEHFTGTRVTRARIQDYKNAGGWNDDWALSHRIATDLGADVTREAVVERFQALFLGPNGDGAGGLIERERWAPEPGLLERLGERHRLAIFTGRPREELNITLGRSAPSIRFDPIICNHEIENNKPAPDGLLRIGELCPGSSMVYVGDTVDDARCARAAGVEFIGVASPANPRRTELSALFASERAIAVVEDVNQLEAVVAQ